MENDLADRIATRLTTGKMKRRQSKGDAEDRLMVWIDGRVLCDRETGAILQDPTTLRRWYAQEGLGYISLADAVELWSNALTNKETVDLKLWQVGEDIEGKRWYYDCSDGEMHYIE